MDTTRLARQTLRAVRMAAQCSHLWPRQPTCGAIVVTKNSDKEGRSRGLRLQLDHATDAEGDGLIHHDRSPSFSKFVFIAREEGHHPVYELERWRGSAGVNIHLNRHSLPSATVRSEPGCR